MFAPTIYLNIYGSFLGTKNKYINEDSTDDMAKETVTYDIPQGGTTVGHNLSAKARSVEFLNSAGEEINLSWRRTPSQPTLSIDVANGSGQDLTDVEINIIAW